MLVEEVISSQTTVSSTDILEPTPTPSSVSPSPSLCADCREEEPWISDSAGQ